MQSVFQQLRSHAMTYPGYIGSENLRSEQDKSIVAMVQNWDKMEDWKSWETSSIQAGHTQGSGAVPAGRTEGDGISNYSYRGLGLDPVGLIFNPRLRTRWA